MMRVRLIKAMWIVIGASLAILSVHGLITEEHSKSVVTSWLIALTFALLAIIAGVLFNGVRISGRILLSIVSALALFYSFIWLLFGGVEDASSYAPVILILVTLSVYSLLSSRKRAHAA